MGRKYIDISGQRFKNLLVLDERITTSKELLWKCKCDCGDFCYAASPDLRRGRTNYCKSCSEKKSKRTTLNLLYYNYKRHAKNRKYVFDLSIDDFEILTSSNCYYCGIEPLQTFEKKGLKYSIKYNGVDRKDNDIGYTKENSVTACKFCNFAKRDFKLKEFMNWINKIKNKKI